MNTRLGLITVLLMAVQSAGIAETVSAEAYAGQGGTLTEGEAARFLIALKEVPLAKVLGPGDTVLTSRMALEAVSDHLVVLRRKISRPAPWAWQDVNRAFDVAVEETETDPVHNGNGVTEMKKWNEAGITGWRGPLRLRKSRDELSRPQEDARGASLGFVNNRLLAGSGAWNSEGVLFYPVKWIKTTTVNDTEHEAEYGADWFVEWKSAETERADESDTEALTLGVQVKRYLYPDTDKPAVWVLQMQPYLNSDFSWDHRIWGAEASLEYIGPFGKHDLHLGGFYNFADSSNQYSLRLVPKLDASYVDKVGKHTKRTLDDDWFRYGLLASLDFRFVVNGRLLEVGTSYQFLQQVDEGRDWSDKWSAHFTWWVNPSVGLSLENTKGESPTTAEDVDSITLGLEVKL